MQANGEKMLRPIFTKYISPAIVHQTWRVSFNFVPYSKQNFTTQIFL